MKKIFIAVIVISLTSCEHKLDNSKNTSTTLGHLSPLQIIKIDGCEYLFGSWGNESVLTHKGDCNNTIHQAE